VAVRVYKFDKDTGRVVHSHTRHGTLHLTPQLARASDFKDTWEKAQSERDAIATGTQSDKPYIEAVEQSFRMLNQGYRPPPPPVVEKDAPVITPGK
jgi:hypothetical protein